MSERNSVTTYSVRWLHPPIPKYINPLKKKKSLKEAAENWGFKLKLVVMVILDLHFSKSFLQEIAKKEVNISTTYKKESLLGPGKVVKKIQ